MELADLIPTRLGFEDTTRSKIKHRSVANISEWLQAFAVYVSVIAKTQPYRVPDLMGYQILIIEASTEYRNNSWLAYDRRFRQQVAAHPQCKWSNIDSTLWTLAFTSQAKTSRCRHCFSLFHLSQDCEFDPNPTSPPIEPQFTGASRVRPVHRRLICQQWNQESSQSCSYPNCRFEHVCSICAFVFVELADLIPTRLGFEDTTRSKIKHRSVANISEWLQAFAVYVSVIAKTQPYRVPDLMGYQILIIEASTEYRNNSWLAYDRRFRQQVAAHPQCKWSNIDSTLWTLAFTSQAKTSRCRHCFSLFHLSQDCEFDPNPTSPPIEPQFTGASRVRPVHRRLICQQWNQESSQSCSYPNCRFEHVCSICAVNPAARDINHKAIVCPNHPAQNHQPINAQRPPPLFPWVRANLPPPPPLYVPWLWL